MDFIIKPSVYLIENIIMNNTKHTVKCWFFRTRVEAINKLSDIGREMEENPEIVTNAGDLKLSPLEFDKVISKCGSEERPDCWAIIEFGNGFAIIYDKDYTGIMRQYYKFNWWRKIKKVML